MVLKLEVARLLIIVFSFTCNIIACEGLIDPGNERMYVLNVRSDNFVISEDERLLIDCCSHGKIWAGTHDSCSGIIPRRVQHQELCFFAQV